MLVQKAETRRHSDIDYRTVDFQMFNYSKSPIFNHISGRFTHFSLGQALAAREALQRWRWIDGLQRNGMGMDGMIWEFWELRLPGSDAHMCCTQTWGSWRYTWLCWIWSWLGPASKLWKEHEKNRSFKRKTHRICSMYCFSPAHPMLGYRR